MNMLRLPDRFAAALRWPRATQAKVTVATRWAGGRHTIVNSGAVLRLFTGCAALPLLAVSTSAAPAPAASPAGAALERFFTGTTEGSGTVRIALSGSHRVRDRSRGRMERGALIIDQVVEEEGKPARRRSWRLVRSGGNKVAGTISDARGPVAGEVTGATLHLRYRLAEGPSVEQWITLQPGGRSARNRMVFHRFGLKVATVETVLRKVE